MTASAAPAFAAAPPPVVSTQSTTTSTTVTSQDLQNLPTNSSNPADVIKANVASGTSKADNNAITVTGSRIRRPNLESVVPVHSVQGEQFFQRGGTDIGDTLNDLPQLRSTFSTFAALVRSAPSYSSTAAVTSPPTFCRAPRFPTSTRSRPTSSSASIS